MILSIHVLRIVTNTFIIAAGDIALDRIEEPIIDIGVEDNSVKALARKTLAVKPFLEVASSQNLLQFQILKLLW